MDPVPLVLALLSFLCSLTCFLSWFGAIVLLARWRSLKEVERLQSRLRSWAAERGDTIVRLERPASGPIGCWLLVSGPFAWVLLPRDSPWTFAWVWKYFGFNAGSYTTRVVFKDRAGRLRQGQMQYVGSPFTGFWGSVESRWEEGDPPPPEPPPESITPEPTPPDPRDDPLWDHWIDTPGAG
jgi:hypothetical protein